MNAVNNAKVVVIFPKYTDFKNCLHFEWYYFFSVSGKLYAIGGRFQHKHSDDVEEYDPVSTFLNLSNYLIYYNYKWNYS